MELLKRVVGQDLRSDLSAIRRMNPSPRPTAPAGGVTISLWSTACSKAAHSEGSIRCPKVASTTTVTSDAENPDLEKGPDRLVELGQAGVESAFGGDVGAVHDDRGDQECSLHTDPVNHLTR